jgi:TPR repeat protein
VATQWFRKAAAQGNGKAQFALAVMYLNGTGVPQDYVQAHKWFNISGSNGLEPGRENRELVAEKMTVEHIAQAQELARDWAEKHGAVYTKVR